MDVANGGPGYNAKGWMVDILPMMEETALHDAIVEGLKTAKGRFSISSPTVGVGMGVGSYPPDVGSATALAFVPVRRIRKALESAVFRAIGSLDGEPANGCHHLL